MLCYYGAGLGTGVSAMERSHLWPDFVRERLRSTYAYLAGGLAVTAGAGYSVSRMPALLTLTAQPTLMVMLGSIALIIATGAVVRSIDYHQSGVAKHAAWLIHCGVLGAVLAPMCMLGGPVLARAAWYTAGVVAGLSATAMCAPSEKFLNMAAPLAMGLGVVFTASIGTFFFPAHTALGAGLASIVVYGGLVLFSAFLLYDTQRVLREAERGNVATSDQVSYGGNRTGSYYGGYDMLGRSSFDPINAQLSIYLDVLNIFIRIAMLMGMSGGQRRK